MPRRRTRPRRLAVASLFAASGAALLWLSLLPAAVRAGFLRATIEAELSATLGIPVRVGEIDLPDGRSCLARQVTLAPNAPGIGPFEVETVAVRFAGLAPFGTIERIAIDGVRGHVDLSADRLRELTRPAAPATEPGARRGFRLSGPLPLPVIRVSRVRIDGRLGPDPYTVRDLEIRIDPATPFVIPFLAQGLLDGAPDPHIDIRGTLELTTTSGGVRLDRLKIGALAARAGLDVPRDDAAAATFRVDSFSVPHSLASLLESFTGVRGRGLMTTNCTLGVDGNRLSRLQFEGELADYQISTGDVKVSPRKGRTRFSMALTPHPEGGWKAEGRITDLEIDLGAGGVLHFPTADYETRVDGARALGTYRFDDAFYARDDLESSKVGGTLAFDVSREGASRVFSGSVRLTLLRAEFLKGELYQEIVSGEPIEFTVGGRFNLDADDYQFKGAGLSIAGLGRVALDGQLRRTANGLAYDVVVATDDVAAARLAEKLAATWSIEGLSMDGALRLRARVTGEGPHYTADGHVLLRDVTARYGALSISRLRGNLPFVLVRGPDQDARFDGSIFFDDLVPCPGVSLGPRRLDVTASPNRLQIPGTIDFELWGGRAKLGPVDFTDLLGLPRYGFVFGVEDLDLARFAAALQIKRPLAGRVTLPSGPVLVSSRQITIAEPARGRAFEGEIDLRGMRVLKPYDGTNRAYQFAFAARDVRLSEICRTLTEFGLIDGVMEGTGTMELHAGGLPNWFQVEMRAVERRGVEQVCDIRAIKALATLISPETAAQIDRLPADKLYYEKFGFFAAMDVDFTFYPRGRYFRLKGTGEVVEQPLEDLRAGKVRPEAGMEHVMVGAGRYQVNINIDPPGGGINFNDIIERFRKVGKK